MIAAHSHLSNPLYRRAKRAAPATTPIPAVAMGTAPPVVGEAEPEPEAELEAESEAVEDEEESVAVSVEVLSEPVEEESEAVPVRVPVTRVVLPLLVTGVTTGEVRPAGIEAAADWEVTTAG